MINKIIAEIEAHRRKFECAGANMPEPYYLSQEEMAEFLNSKYGLESMSWRLDNKQPMFRFRGVPILSKPLKKSQRGRE